jgi:hypothetical protein
MELPTVTAPAQTAVVVHRRPPPDLETAPIDAPPKPPPRKARPHFVRTVEGRPFLVRDRPRLASVMAGPGWSENVDLVGVSLTHTERDALVRHYTDWALAEHASIASFARFALQLLALGAPADLVARATAAMGDEIRHAQFGFGLVRALSGACVTPGTLSMDHALEEDATLEHVLRLVVREGMIGETLAALEVANAADLAELPALKEPLATIARDEARHAELAYVFAAWALERSPDLARVVDEEVAAWRMDALPVVNGLSRWGILDAAARRTVRAHGFERVVQPLAQRIVMVTFTLSRTRGNFVASGV